MLLNVPEVSGFPTAELVDGQCPLPAPQGLTFRLWFRSLYVIVLTIIASGASFFSLIVGLVGATGGRCAVMMCYEHIQLMNPAKCHRDLQSTATNFYRFS